LINNFFQKILNISFFLVYSFSFFENIIPPLNNCFNFVCFKGLFDVLIKNYVFLSDELKQGQAMRIVSPCLILDMTSVNGTSFGCAL
jgi:hypothetical protein